MTYRPGRHIYFAAGFFSPRQRDLCDFVESLEVLPDMPIYSPRTDGGVLKPDSSTEEIKETFESNKVAIETSVFVLAVVDDFDPGVIWEMGYAHAKGKAILAFSEVEGRTLNVMLAGACPLGFIVGRPELKRVLKKFNGWNDDALPYNTWSGEIQ